MSDEYKPYVVEPVDRLASELAAAVIQVRQESDPRRAVLLYYEIRNMLCDDRDAGNELFPEEGDGPLITPIG